jgi:CheY-like chemotaxis protein
MTFPALLISDDDEAAAVLAPVLSAFGSTVLRCGHAEAANRLTQEKFAAVVVDFEDSRLTSHTFPSTEPPSAGLVLRQAQQAISGHRSVTIALLSDKTKVRSAIAAGANFILYKPIVAEQAKAALRAAAALFKRDRRQTYRVPVQVPVQLKAGNEKTMEGILLDLGSDGLDVLMPEALPPATSIHVHFGLPGSGITVDASGEVAWSNPNGETGVRLRKVAAELRRAMQEWLASNRREHPAAEPEETVEGKLTDLSLGGCYVETEAPFPEQFGVTLRLKADEIEVEAEGVVRVMHPGLGMGIEFGCNTTEERARVANFIGFLKASPGTTPELAIRPRDLVAAHGPATEEEDPLFFVEMDDPLLNLLHHHERFSPEEFLQQLRNQRDGSAAGAN